MTRRFSFAPLSPALVALDYAEGRRPIGDRDADVLFNASDGQSLHARGESEDTPPKGLDVQMVAVAEARGQRLLDGC